MRFHIGFSKRISIKTIFTLISALFIGLCAFLGITEHEIVYAATSSDLPPSSFYYYNNTSESSPIYPTIGANQYNYAWSISNPGSNSFNFTFIYNFSSIDCSSRKADLDTDFFMNLNSVGFQQQYNNFSVTYVSGGSIYPTISVNDNGNGTSLFLRNVDLSKPIKIVFNTSNENYATQILVDKQWNYSCLADNTANIIDNQNQNTQDIINNNNQNTQDIIDNQNANNQALIDSQKVCTSKLIDKESIILNDVALLSDGSIDSRYGTNWGITDYYSINSESTITVLVTRSGVASSCFYNSSYTLISCITSNNLANNVNIPTGSSYVRFSINYLDNRPTFSVNSCGNGNQAVVDSNNQLNDSLNDSNVDSNTGTDFFDMNINEHGIASILTSPIRLLQALTTSNDSCNPLNLSINLDGTSKEVSIPSGCILWDMVPNSISAIFIAIVYGLFAYYVLIDLYKFVHGLLDPDDKNMYVMDL